MANSVNFDQTVFPGAVLCRSTLSEYFILSETLACNILGHLQY